jgi:aldehyde dehydrogenase (NAD+)
MTKSELDRIFEDQKRFFETGYTKDVKNRVELLSKLKKKVSDSEDLICSALEKDLGKSRTETFLTEIYMIMTEINYFMKNIPALCAPKKVKTPLSAFPGKSLIFAEPYGTVLIISPWNYPLQLALAPLVGAVAAGNCIILKPSEYAPHTAAALEKIISGVFSKEHVCTVCGGIEETSYLLEKPNDYIFFTGSPQIGKVVMEKAALNLTPLTLELGGKSPCIVDRTADIALSAKRIAWGKFINAGQTCVAPDYILIEEEIKERFLKELIKHIELFYAYADKEHSNGYAQFPRIINEKHFSRLEGYIKNQKVIYGGICEREKLFISPTIIENPYLDSPVMQNEIFGPVLPVIEVSCREEALEFVKNFPKPLALYIFSNDSEFVSKSLNTISSGGACINDTISHITSEHLPFGGVGNSGMGSYHGKSSFDTFTHYKSVLFKGRLDIKAKYPPYGENFILNLIKKIISK